MPRRSGQPVLPGVPIVTLAVASVILLCFAVQLVQVAQVAPGSRALSAPIIDLLAIDPHHFRWTMLFSHVLPHAGWGHLLMNMLGLTLFAPAIEARFGRVGFFLLFLAGAAAAGGAHVAMSDASAIGASGAIAAVTGAYLVLYPTSPMAILFAPTPIPAWVVIGVFIAKDLFHATSGSAHSAGVANWAHLGGYGAGILIAGLALALGWLPRDEHDLGSVIGRRRRRLAFKSSVTMATLERQAPGPKDELPAEIEDLARRRAEILGLIGAGKMAAAAEAYQRLVQDRGEPGTGIVLPRVRQGELAAFLLSAGNKPLAALAYEQYAATYAQEPDAGPARLLVAVLALRSLNQPARARAALEGLEDRLRTDADRALYRELIQELSSHEPARPTT